MNLEEAFRLHLGFQGSNVIKHKLHALKTGDISFDISSSYMSQKKNELVIISLGLILYTPRKNISYDGITDRPQRFNMMASGLQIIYFDLTSNLKFKTFT